MSSAIIDEKGRITIPQDLRKKLGLEAGTKVVFSVVKNTVLIRKELSISEYEKIADEISKELKEKLDSPIEIEKLF